MKTSHVLPKTITILFLHIRDPNLVNRCISSWCRMVLSQNLVQDHVMGIITAKRDATF